MNSRWTTRGYKGLLPRSTSSVWIWNWTKTSAQEQEKEDFIVKTSAASPASSSPRHIFLITMSLIDANSCLCANSELDLFTVPPTQTSIESGSYVEYHPVAALNNTNVIEFTLPGSSEDYLDLASTYLYVQAKLTNAGGSDTDGGDCVGPVNLMLHSLLPQIYVALNGKTITSSTSTYAYRAMVETLLDYGKPAKESQLTAALFYKDSAGHMDETDTGNAESNIGLRRRVTHTVDSRVVDMMGRLHCDLFFQEKLMISSVGMHLRLVQSKSAFVIMSGTQDAKYVVEIFKATLRVRKVRISPTVALAHAKALEYANAKYPMQRVECKTFTVPANHVSINQENVFMGQLPTRVVIGCVDNDAYTGRYTKNPNPFNFKNYKLTRNFSASRRTKPACEPLRVQLRHQSNRSRLHGPIHRHWKGIQRRRY
jgi:hypothetical protein